MCKLTQCVNGCVDGVDSPATQSLGECCRPELERCNLIVFCGCHDDRFRASCRVHFLRDVRFYICAFSFA